MNSKTGYHERYNHRRDHHHPNCGDLYHGNNLDDEEGRQGDGRMEKKQILDSGASTVIGLPPTDSGRRFLKRLFLNGL